MNNNFGLDEFLKEYYEKVKPIKDKQLKNSEEVKNLCNKYFNENNIHRRVTKVDEGLNGFYLTILDTTPCTEEV